MHKVLENIWNSRHINIFVFLWGFIFAIFLSSIINIRPLWSILFFIIAFGVFFSEKILNKSVSKLILIVVLVLISFGVGILRYDIKDFHEPNQNIESEVGSKINLVGVVVSEPEQREKDTRFVLKSFGEKILVSTSLYSNIKYGDELSVEGKLLKPGIIEASDAGRAFDYAAYLSKDDIYYTMSFAQTNILSHNNANPILASLLKIKESFVSRMKSILSEPESSLLAGLLVSGKQALPKSIIEEFRRAGVVHVVVLSGYNINIVAEFFTKIFSFLSLRLAGSASILGIILFTLMTGATATVVRAAIMALIAISGKFFGRSYSASRALLVAGFFMLLQNPKILVFDSSFQLSMLATIAMIYAVPIVDRYLSRGALAKRDKFREILSATIATQIFVLPYLLYSMGNISIVSLFSNILILAFIPLTMLLGFIATTLAYVSTVFALPFSYTTHLLLAWILGVAHMLGNLSWASLNVSSFSLVGMVMCYVIFGFIWWRLRNSPQQFSNSN